MPAVCPYTIPEILARLTDRERVVLLLIGDCLSARQIGGILKISAKTVEFHKKRIFERLGVSSSNQLVRLVVQSGLSLGREEDSLRPDNARLVRALRLAGWTHAQIGEQLGVSAQQVGRIIRRCKE